MGLSVVDDRHRDEIATGLAAFVAANATSLGYDDGFAPTLTVVSVKPIDDALTSVHFDQWVEGLRVVDSEVTAGFFVDGALQSVNGLFAARGEIADALSVDDLAQRLRTSGIDVPKALVFDGQRYVADGYTLERGYCALAQASVWQVTTPTDVVTVDEPSATVVDVTSLSVQLYNDVTKPCSVLRREVSIISIAGVSTVTSLLETGTNVSQPMTCGGDSWPLDSCYWYLKRQPSGFAHPIAQVQDANGAEQEVPQACSSSAPLVFGGSNGDFLREQVAFVAEGNMREHTRQLTWSQVAPEREANVQITVDDTSVTTALFNRVLTDIFCNNLTPRLGGGTFDSCTYDVLAHEYGHYVVWSYGDVSSTCTPGIDEGSSLNETLANVIGEMDYLDFYLDAGKAVQYGAVTDFAQSNGPSPHTTAGTIINAAPSCPQLNDPTDGMGFKQAFWELLYNANCSTAACSLTTPFRNDIWIGQNPVQVRARMGAALAFGLDLLGANITRTQLVVAMRNRIATLDGTATANRMRAVFTHHGCRRKP